MWKINSSCPGKYCLRHKSTSTTIHIDGKRKGTVDTSISLWSLASVNKRGNFHCGCGFETLQLSSSIVDHLMNCIQVKAITLANTCSIRDGSLTTHVCLTYDQSTAACSMSSLPTRRINTKRHIKARMKKAHTLHCRSLRIGMNVHILAFQSWLVALIALDCEGRVAYIRSAYVGKVKRRVKQQTCAKS